MTRAMSLAVCLRTVRRVLVLRRKALGDALVTLPAVLELAAALPGATIDLVVDRPFAPLLAALASDLHVVAWPPREGGWLRQLRTARYDLVVDYLGSPRTALWTALTAAPLRVGYDLPRRRWAYNVRVPRNRVAGAEVAAFAGEAFLDPLRALGLDPSPWRAAGEGALTVSAAALSPRYRDWIATWEATPRPRAAMIFSASWSAKAWPAAAAARLADQLTHAGVMALLVPGPGDEPYVAAMREVLPAAEVAPPTTLLELADLLARCDVCVGTDNGSRHLATCLGVPTVTLFGPTDTRGWNPADPRHVALRHPVPCAPCNLTACPVPGHPCLDALAPATVTAAVLALLGRLSATAPV